MTSICYLVLFLGLVIVVSGKLQIPKIQILKQQTQVLSEQNPRNGPVCFSVYRPVLDSISIQYEVDYTNCNTSFANQIALEDSKWQGPRSQMEESGGHSCRVMTDCSSIVGYVEAFECYAQMGAEQSKAMYTLSADSNEVAVEIKEFYRVIESTKAICINNAERTYVEQTTTTYEQLNSCLSGNILPSVTTESTTRTPTTPFTTTTYSPF